jgi:23S rRNA (cytidine1920-2'-O)/16S rRNA (cytidine1409-2'-O)-methyltransferase
MDRGLAESRAKAQALVMAGQIRVDGQVVLKPATQVQAAARLELIPGPRFVSRGGEKLEAAIASFGVDVTGSICADVGASTGGFTDCLLQHGAAKVYALDVGKGQLHWKLRNDPRLVVMEETNARFVKGLPERVDLVTIDAAFISLKVLLPVVKGWLAPFQTEKEQGIIALIKPQFEAGKREAARSKGVIRDPLIHKQVLIDLLNFAQQAGFGIGGLVRSPILGPKGNTEFLVWLTNQTTSADIEAMIENVVSK